jgi:hypothetical protein
MLADKLITSEECRLNLDLNCVAVLLTGRTSAADYLESRMDFALREIQDECLDRGKAGRVATLIEFAIGLKPAHPPARRGRTAQG